MPLETHPNLGGQEGSLLGKRNTRKLDIPGWPQGRTQQEGALVRACVDTASSLPSVSLLGPSANPETKQGRQAGQDDLSHHHKFTYHKIRHKNQDIPQI